MYGYFSKKKKKLHKTSNCFSDFLNLFFETLVSVKKLS